MIGKTNTGGGGGLGGTAALTVKAPIDVTTTVSKGDKTFTRTSGPTGTVKFSGLSTGTWNVKISDGLGQQRDRNVEIKADYDTTIAFFEATINITYPVGSTVQVKYSTYTFNAPNTSGFWACKVPSAGNWVITSTLGVESDTKTVSITRDLQTENVTLAYNKIPEFTYTGDYEIVNDQDEVITESKDNWKIRFLTSGELQFSELRGAEQGIDVFLVGGGGGGALASEEYNSGGGGGGGYTKTVKKKQVDLNKYSLTIGAGGGLGAKGGATQAFEAEALGGFAGLRCATCATGTQNSNGGSGGGAKYGQAGGSDGRSSQEWDGKNGTGQGTTTREFGEPGGKLYAGGGGSGHYWNAPGNTRKGGEGGGADGAASDSKPATNAKSNTGGGGGGGSNRVGNGSSGGSGIIVIRNARN